MLGAQGLKAAFSRYADPALAGSAAFALAATCTTAWLRRRDAKLREAAVNAELRLANERLQATVEELERSDRIKGEFLNTVSHDLRIPLTTITGYAELLEDRTGPDPSPDQREAIDAILAAAERMKRLLDDLLDFARMEAGRFRLDLQPVALGELVREAIEGIRPLASRKHQTIEARGDPNLPEIEADSGRLVQVLNNLLSNAVKFTGNGGRIAVTWRKEGDQAIFSVSDTGIGISRRDQARLFSKFFRVDHPGSDAGHGLGLAISKALIEAHGGTVRVQSEPGRGSTFTVRLPLKASRSPEPTGGLPPEATGR